MSVHDRMTNLFGKVLPRCLHGEAHLLGKGFQEVPVELLLGLGPVPGLDRPILEALVRIRYNQLRVDFQAETQTCAGRAGTIGGVEGEGTGLDLIQLQFVPVGAGTFLGERLTPSGVLLVEIDEVDNDGSLGKAEGRFHGVGQALSGRRLDDQAVNHHLYGVLLLFGQFDFLGKLAHLAVDDCPGVSIRTQQFQCLDEFALAALGNGGQNLEARSFRLAQEVVNNLLRGLRPYLLTADRTVRDARTGEEEPQVVIDLGNGSNRRAGIAIGGLLVDGNRWAQSLDEVNVGLVHLPQELAGV